MNRKGFARPGALQMLISVVGSLVCAIYPMYIAATSPGHEYALILTGMSAFLLVLAYGLLFILYIIGFARYAASKGYGPLVVVLLLIANAIGFLLLLLLPDRRSNINAA
jgi:hypothetical protein